MSKRPTRLPIIIVTGASGFIGRHFIRSFRDDFYIYAMARRRQKTVDLEEHPNVKWIRVDVGDRDAVMRVMKDIEAQGGADFLLHLAGYYDFENEENPEYYRTNVVGTRNVLESAVNLNLKRFIFTSSLTVSEFHKPDTVLREDSPGNANFPYARTKRAAEELIENFADNYPVAIIRLAAIFSDWCEYGPLYVFLTTWLSQHWNSRILAGKGITAIPYLHVKNLNSFFYAVMRKTELLPKSVTLIASPDGSSSHNELYEIAVRYNFGYTIDPILMPKLFAYLGTMSLDVIGRIRGKRPFERPWMIKYVDLIMQVDASRSRAMLEWQPIRRYHVTRRLLFLLENMKSNPHEWNRRNTEAIYRKRMMPQNLLIYESMVKLEEQVVDQIFKEMIIEAQAESFPTYQNLARKKLHDRVRNVYEMLKTAVRTGDRMHVLNYAHNLSIERFVEGFESKEVINAVEFIANFVVRILHIQPELKDMDQRIHDEILMTVQLIVDEIEDSYDRLSGRP